MNFYSKRNIGLIVVLSCLLTAGCSTYGRGTNQIEVVEASENRALNLLQQINDLESENADLKNQVEVMQYEMDQINRRVQSQQTELDRLYGQEGLGGVDGQASGGGYDYQQQPSNGADGGYQAQTQEIDVGGSQQSGQYPVASTGASSLSAQDLYSNGFDQLKQGQYPESIQTFNQLLAQHSGSTFADDAQYWIGEAHYVNREFDSARGAFSNVVNNYSSSDRAPDALLKIGYIYYEQGDTINARNVFNDIIVKYPNEQVAEYAKERLKKMGG